MTKKADGKSDDPAQSKRFVEAARKAEADESREGADRAFSKFIRGARPKGPVPKKKDIR
jgi:hypothetical protein